MSKQGNYTEAIKEAESKVQGKDGLNPNVTRWAQFRRWLGIYTRSEREVMAYANRIKQETIGVVSRQKIVTHRPDWMRHEDYQQLRALQNKIERKKPNRK